jgi:hypothetical protein
MIGFRVRRVAAIRPFRRSPFLILSLFFDFSSGLSIFLAGRWLFLAGWRPVSSAGRSRRIERRL